MADGWTHWGRDTMAAFSHTTFSHALSWMKMYEFCLTFHWSLFLTVKLTIFQHWFRLMVWHRPRGKPLSDPMVFSLLTHISATQLLFHYIDVIMTTMASQITSLMVVYSTVYSDADQRKHQSSVSLPFVCEIHRDRWIPRTKGQLRGKCFHLMTSSCISVTQSKSSQL